MVRGGLCKGMLFQCVEKVAALSIFVKSANCFGLGEAKYCGEIIEQTGTSVDVGS